MALTPLRERRIAPNWRGALRTVRNGELDPLASGSDGTLHDPSRAMSAYLEDWKNEEALWSAAALVDAAISNHATSNPKVKAAAKYILESDPLCVSTHLRDNASACLGSNTSKSSSDCLLDDSLKQEHHIRTEIQRLRAVVRISFRNPIAHLDLARAYLQNGQWDKARDEAMIAQALAPDNRYVTRSAVKCMLHFNDVDRAAYIVRCNTSRKSDPWVVSAQLAIDLRKDNPSNYFKIGIGLLKGPLGDTKSTSELAAAVATMEASRGSAKSVRKFLRSSLVDPIDNSVAQAHWLAHMDPAYNVLEEWDGEEEKILYNYEAATFDCLRRLNDKEAYGWARKWVEDKPFSRRAVIEASNIAFRLQKLDEAIALLKDGMRANPGAEGVDLINNAAYIYLLQDDIAEADLQLKKINFKVDEGSPTHICLTATRGLREFRSHNIEKGEELYKDAIEESIKYGFRDHRDNAWLNLINERRKVGIITDSEAAEQLDKYFPREKRNAMNPHIRGILLKMESQFQNIQNNG